MTRIILAALLAVFAWIAAPHANAQTANTSGTEIIARPALRDAVTVNGPVVRIGDLVEHAGEKAGIAVFRSPDPGMSGLVPADAIVEALRAQGVIAVDTRDIAEVRVTRPSNAITADHLKERIAAALAQRGGLGEADDLTIRFDGEIAPLEIDPARRDDLRLARASFNPQTARFEANFIYAPKDAPAQRLRYTGTAQELVGVAVLNRSLERGAVVRADDLTVERRPRNEVSAEYVSLAQAAGKALKRAMRAGQPLRDSDLSRPLMVQRGESVIIIYRTSGIYLTIRGKAEESGALGDVVAITNLQSKRTMQGVVSGPGEISVSPAGRVSAHANTPTRHAALEAGAATISSAE